MIVALIIACEVAFWVFLALGLSLRYLAKKPRAGAAVLLCEPLLEVVLLVVTVIDLRNGASPDWKHGLAALYIGYTAAHGHATVKWLDELFAHRFAGGPRPLKRYGFDRAKYEWRVWLRSLGGAALALGLLQLAIWYVGDASRTESLVGWQGQTLKLLGIHGLIALGYTVFPSKPPASEAAATGERRPLSRLLR
ncbi:hypothetical protein [Streptomyces sp. NPDC002851]